MKLPMTLTVAAVVAAVVAPSANAMSTSRLVHRAGGHPYRCNIGSNSWGQNELKCVIIVVMPSAWERWGLRVGKCESGGDHYEADPPPNPASSAKGLFQFLDSTWRTTPQYKAAYRRLRRAGASIRNAIRYAARKVRDPVANSYGARWLVSTSGPSQWDCK